LAHNLLLSHPSPTSPPTATLSGCIWLLADFVEGLAARVEFPRPDAVLEVRRAICDGRPAAQPDDPAARSDLFWHPLYISTHCTLFLCPLLSIVDLLFSRLSLANPMSLWFDNTIPPPPSIIPRLMGGIFKGVTHCRNNSVSSSSPRCGGG